MEKILVIDDSAVHSEYLCSVLRAEYDMTVCQTGTGGLQTAKEGDFSLILLDIIMPDMDGFTVLRELKAADKTKHIPVILLTSLADVQYEELGLLLGAVDYVAKPFSPVIIKARVNTHIELYHYQTDVLKQAQVDRLTGVANRRCYEDVCMSKWNEAIRFELPFSVCMFDIDKFKIYNDTFGHQAGDDVIAAVAQAADKHFQRSTDFFARYGGEEFVALFLGNDDRSAFEFIKTIRQAVEDLQIPHDPSVGPYVTISAGGVTLRPKVGDRYETYLKLADTMLYDAKRLGRNQVVWTSETMEHWVER